MSFTNGRSSQAPASVTSIPLTELDVPVPPQQASIGELVKDASAQISTLVRAEVELAKAEITGEVKKGVMGSVFFIVALVILLFSSFFFFFFLAELLSVWLPRWAGFGVVFLLMLVGAGFCAFLGYLKVKKIRAPEKTISSLKQAKTVLPKGPNAVTAKLPHGELN